MEFLVFDGERVGAANTTLRRLLRKKRILKDGSVPQKYKKWPYAGDVIRKAQKGATKTEPNEEHLFEDMLRAMLFRAGYKNTRPLPPFKGVSLYRTQHQCAS